MTTATWGITAAELIAGVPRRLHVAGTSEQITAALVGGFPEIPRVLAAAKAACPPRKRSIAEYQGAVLYAAARPYNRQGARILEIGTFEGYSAHVLAQACPLAHVITLNPKDWERETARVHLQHLPRVTLRGTLSWDYLDEHLRRGHPPFDVIFVDGDHAQILRDLPWYDQLGEGGLMLFHDYSPAESPRPCPPVYEALNAMSRALGRDFDLLAVDDTGVGMAGFVRRPQDAGWRELMP